MLRRKCSSCGESGNRGGRLRKAVTVFSLTAGIGAVCLGVLFAPVGGILGGAGEAAKDMENVESSAVVTSGTVEEGSWGLSFREEGKAPEGNASREEMAQYNAFYIGPEEQTVEGVDGEPKKTIYLTFDAGYENGCTEKILDTLKEKSVPAAFFLVGNYITENTELVKRMEAEGHIVGNHTMHHPDMWTISDTESFEKELKDLEYTYKSVTGKEMLKFYRPPQGKYSTANLQQARDLGYTTIFWSLAYVDWLENDQPTREEALNLLNKRIHPGAIVLLHSTSKTNSKILGELIDGWREKGYEFASISELGLSKV